MKDHRNSERLQEIGLKLVNKVCEQASRDARNLFIPAYDLTLEAMRAFPNSSRISESACAFLGHLTTLDDARNLMIRDEKSLQCVVGAMRKHEHVVTSACGVLINLASNKENKSVIKRIFGDLLQALQLKHKSPNIANLCLSLDSN